MIDDYQQILSAYALGLPHKSRLMQPMSKKAKRLLVAMLEWSKPYHGKFWSPKGTPDFMKDFYAQFTPLRYEEICHRFNIDHHLIAFKKNKTGIIPGHHRTKDEILASMQLLHFEDSSWVKEAALLDSGKRMGSLSTLHAIQVYEWLTTHFLITDFTEDDLSRIAHLSDEKFNFETIKREAGRITDPDKHNMAYLYAIIKDVTIKEEWARQKTAEVLSSQEQKLQKVVEFALESKNKLAHQFPTDMKERWERDLEFLDISRDLKNKQ